MPGILQFWQDNDIMSEKGAGHNGLDIITGWERTVHVSRCLALYSGRIFVPLCNYRSFGHATLIFVYCHDVLYFHV